MKLLTASKLLILPFLASINAVQAVEKDAASKVNSLLKRHRVLHQQKLNEFKKQARNLEELELSDDTKQLLSCYENEYYPFPEDFTYTVNKKGYDQLTYSYAEACQENYKAVKQESLYCEFVYFDEAPLIVTEKVCIPDSDTCPNDYVALLTAIADALKSEGDEYGYEYFSMEATYFSKDKCAYPQCFAKPNKELTFTYGYYEENEEDPPSSPYTCPAIGGSCEVDCEDDYDFICIPGLCYGNKDYDADYYSEEYDGPDEKNLAPEAGHLRSFFKTGGNKRHLKATKAPKAPKGGKAPKAGKCTCKAPRNEIW